MAKVTKNYEAVISCLDSGKSVRDSLRAGGYSEANAKRGLAAMPEALRRKIGLKKLHALAAAGRSFTPEERADIARGACLANIEEGKDKAAASIKLLGQEVGMWGNDGEAIVQISVNQSLVPQPLRDYAELFHDEKARRDGRLLRAQRDIELAVVGNELPQSEE